MGIGHFVCFQNGCTLKNTSISSEAHIHHCLREVRKKQKEHIFQAQLDKKNYQIAEFIATYIYSLYKMIFNGWLSMTWLKAIPYRTKNRKPENLQRQCFHQIKYKNCIQKAVCGVCVCKRHKKRRKRSSSAWHVECNLVLRMT